MLFNVSALPTQNLNQTIPMGIIQATPQGFNIEQYVPRTLVYECHDKSFITNIKSFLFEEMYWKLFVQPFLDHTVKGILWYQGGLKLVGVD